MGDSPGRKPSTPTGQPSPRPTSYASPSRAAEGGTPTQEAPLEGEQRPPAAPQTLSFAPLRTIYEIKANPPKREIITYSKGVQTSGPLSPGRERSGTLSGSEDEDGRPTTSSSGRTRRRLSRRQRDEELRQQIRKELEEELKSIQQGPQVDVVDGQHQKENFPARPLNTEELDAVTSSNDFLDFVDRSSKIIERALDEEYDVLADYRYGDVAGDSSDEDDAAVAAGRKSHRKGRRLKEVHQFWDEKWSKRRVISDISFSPKVPSQSHIPFHPPPITNTLPVS